MSEKNDGGFAFPVPRDHDSDRVDGQFVYHRGMSLRDYFAGQSLAAYALQYQDHMGAADIASQCYSLADAMIAERAKQ